MLWNFDALRGFSLRARDGSLGTVHDILFDDRSWAVRYLVVDTGWLFGRRVLLSPSAVGEPDADSRQFPVDLTVDQVKHSPSSDTDRPVSRQMELELHAYYGWDPYWTAGGALGMTGMAPMLGPGLGAIPPGVAEPGLGEGPGAAPPDDDSRHLRSARELHGYALAATDGDIGSVDDLLIDSANWHVRWLVVDTGTWLAGRPVLAAPDWVREIDWMESRVFVTVSRAKVEGAPAYDPARMLSRDQEQDLYNWHGLPPYW